MRVAFATCTAMPGGWEHDRPAAQALGAEFLAWDDPSIDWGRYDRVVIRSTWNYSFHPERFLDWCRRVGPERLRNSPDLVAFNLDKRYLLELGSPSVPTMLVAPGDPAPILAEEVVVKPNVSAGARDTGRFGPRAHDEARELIARINASGRVALVQPYIGSVDAHGEASLVFFGGSFSHALGKRAVLQPDEVAPATDGELGVAKAMLAEDLVVAAGTPGTIELSFAQRVLDEISTRFGTPLYARVDIVHGERGPLLMELEAVEPNLYVELAPGAAERFAEAVRGS